MAVPAPPATPAHHPPSPMRRRRLVRLALALGVTAALLSVAPAAGAHPSSHHRHTAYQQTNLVSDLPGRAAITDPNLVNPWGLVAGPTTPIWSNDNGTGVSTLYSGGVGGSTPAIVPVVVQVPGGADTGIVFNDTAGFTVSAGGVTAPARFIFVTEAGTLSGWAPNVPLNGVAQLKKTIRGAVYKGLANLTTDRGAFLYAANFSAARIDVFNSKWKRVHKDGFRDPRLPRGYAPFNIQALGGKLYVAYAKQDSEGTDEVAGPGRGFVDVFDSSGHLLDRLIRRGHLNAPWGLVIAPDGFGQFSGDLLVGNFGDGRIHAYDPHNGHFRGALRDEHGREIVIDGLWALRFGNGVFGDPTDLVFSAGIEDETHGLLGIIEPASG
jgi:uncharacterized protein (TIGR03118 family)